MRANFITPAGPSDVCRFCKKRANYRYYRVGVFSFKWGGLCEEHRLEYNNGVLKV
jgi:hypothetical protein